METINISINIKDLADKKGNLGSDHKWNEPLLGDYSNKELDFLINYPLGDGKGVIVTITKPKTVSDILIPLANTYAEIYKNKKSMEEYSVWGHNFKDLWFERIFISQFTKNKIIVGS